MRRYLLKLIRRRNLQAEFEAELAHHREMAELHGNPIGLGNTTKIQEESLDLWRFNLLENFLRDLTYAVRQLRNSPTFTATAILSLALGIGLAVCIFTLLNAVALRPLPYSDPARLVWMTQILKSNSTDDITITPDFLNWRDQNHTFTDLAAYNLITSNLSGVAEPLQMNVIKGLGIVASDARRSTLHRAQFPATGRPERQRSRSSSQPQLMGATVCRRQRRDWPADNARRHAIHHRWRAARKLRISRA
jgi:hypothetical protein